MIIENPAALQFLIQEDIYLVKKDIDNLGSAVPEPSLVTEKTPIALPEQPVVIETPVLSFQYLGKNGKQFLILCSYPGADAMDEKHLEALKSALQRKELALDDMVILNIANYPQATIAQLQEYFKPQRLLLLGEPCLLNGWDKFTLNQLENQTGIKALYTYSFTEMMGDRDKTKAFWEQMKVL
jgi:hypothetical protein